MYVDRLNCELTLEIAKLHAKQLLEKSPDKFTEISAPLSFIEQTLWGLYLEKSKRKAKHKVMVSRRNVHTR